MPTPLQPKSIRNLGVHGIIRPAEVDDSLIPDGAVTEAVNFHFDRKGSATLRPGMTRLGVSASTNAVADNLIPIGMFATSQSAIIINFAGGSNAGRRYMGASTEIAVSFTNTFTGSGKVRFAEFSDRVIAVDGTYTSIVAAAGPYYTSSVAGNPLNINQFGGGSTTLRASLIEVFKSRIYLSGDATLTSRLWYSSVADTNGNISWTPSTDYVDVNPGDGEVITSIKRYSLELVVFKPNYMYRFRTSGLDPDPLIKIGTRSHESVVEGKSGLYFHHDSGFYRYSGGYPVDISRSISDIVAAIPFTRYDKVVGWRDSDHIYWSIGNVTLEETYGNSTWTSVVLRYTESSGVWTAYSYATEIRRAVPFVTAAASSIIVGLNNGVIAILDSGLTDLGEPIRYRTVTKWYEWEGIHNRKVIQRLVTLCEKARDAHIMYQMDDDQTWYELGQMTKYLDVWGPLSIKFHRIRFKVSGVSSGEATIFRGIEIIEGTNEGLVR